MEFYKASRISGVECNDSQFYRIYLVSFVCCSLIVDLDMETWNKWVSAILWRSSRFARFVFTFNTSLFNFTNEILQRDFAIVFKGWPKEKSKLYSEDKEVIKILKDMKWQHSLKYHGNDNCTTCSWIESVKLKWE